jgi:Leucine-rich repeat (LRR) protein
VTELPPCLGNLASLRYLNVSGNRLTSLPESIGGMAALKELRAASNQLTELPATVATLEKLDVRWNPIQPEPAWLSDLEQRGCTVWC